MVRVEFTISRRHLLVLVGVLVAGVLAVPGVSWAAGRFDDVPSDNVFVADIEWLADAGITRGCNPPANTRFCPGSYVTREQMAAFMHRLAGGDSRTVDGRLDALEAENAQLRSLLAGVSRNGDTLLFTGMNIQVVNGEGSTNTSNSLGNVIIGYHKAPSLPTRGYRDGSHYLIVGDGHTYTEYGGIVSGYLNTASGTFASVTGGEGNTASGRYASVTGGDNNTASGYAASVSGGSSNTASSPGTSVSGGYRNIASGDNGSVTGGRDNTANGSFSSVIGGDDLYVGSSSAAAAGEGFWNTVD